MLKRTASVLCFVLAICGCIPRTLNECEELFKLRDGRFLCLHDRLGKGIAFQHGKASIYHDNGLFTAAPDALYTTLTGQVFLVENGVARPRSGYTMLKNRVMMNFVDISPERPGGLTGKNAVAAYLCDPPKVSISKDSEKRLKYFSERRCIPAKDGNYETIRNFKFTLKSGMPVPLNSEENLVCNYSGNDFKDVLNCKEKTW